MTAQELYDIFELEFQDAMRLLQHHYVAGGTAYEEALARYRALKQIREKMRIALGLDPKVLRDHGPAVR